MRALLIVAMWGCCACVSVRATTAPGANLASYHAFAWAEPRDRSDVELRQSPAGQAIRAQLARNLVELKGMREVDPARADFLVGFDYVTEEKLARLRTGSGWGYDFYYGGGPREGTTFREYTEGTLIVDFIDAKTQKTFWRGTAASVVDQPENPRLGKLAKAVDKVMTRF